MAVAVFCLLLFVFAVALTIWQVRRMLQGGASGAAPGNSARPLDVQLSEGLEPGELVQRVITSVDADVAVAVTNRRLLQLRRSTAGAWHVGVWCYWDDVSSIQKSALSDTVVVNVYGNPVSLTFRVEGLDRNELVAWLSEYRMLLKVGPTGPVSPTAVDMPSLTAAQMAVLRALVAGLRFDGQIGPFSEARLGRDSSADGAWTLFFISDEMDPGQLAAEIAARQQGAVGEREGLVLAPPRVVRRADAQRLASLPLVASWDELDPREPRRGRLPAAAA